MRDRRVRIRDVGGDETVALLIKEDGRSTASGEPAIAGGWDASARRLPT
jgi:hypothetical protein